MDKGEDFQLIDVREEFEYEVSNLGGLLIPLGGILIEADKISKDKFVSSTLPQRQTQCGCYYAVRGPWVIPIYIICRAVFWPGQVKLTLP